MKAINFLLAMLLTLVVAEIAESSVATPGSPPASVHIAHDDLTSDRNLPFNHPTELII